MGKIDGFKSALEALRSLDRRSQERILAEILKTDPEMSKKLKASLISFDDLLKVNPQGIVTLFSEIPDPKWVLALRNKTPDFISQLMSPLAARRIELIKAAVSQLGPQALSRIEAAQREILIKTLELESHGQIVFAKDDDPLV